MSKHLFCPFTSQISTSLAHNLSSELQNDSKRMQNVIQPSKTASLEGNVIHLESQFPLRSIISYFLG